MGGKQSTNVTTSNTSSTSGPVTAISARPLASEAPAEDDFVRVPRFNDRARGSYRTRPLPSLPGSPGNDSRSRVDLRPPRHDSRPEIRPHSRPPESRPRLDSRPLPPIPSLPRNEPINIDFNTFLTQLANERLHPPSSRHGSHTHSPRERRQLPSSLRGLREERSLSYNDRARERHLALGILLRDIALSEPPKKKCPHCSIDVPDDGYTDHIKSCPSRPRLQYNENVLSHDSGECAICLDDMCAGDTIARLPCLCVYHIKCVEEWFTVRESCPEHPDLSV